MAKHVQMLARETTRRCWTPASHPTPQEVFDECFYLAQAHIRNGNGYRPCDWRCRSGRRNRCRTGLRSEKEENKASYSKEFIGAYQPVKEAAEAEGADINALKPQLLALVPLANSEDEKMAAGTLLYNSSIGIKDQSLQLQGMELMLASGKIPIAEIGRYNFIAYQLSNATGQQPKARKYLQQAINLNFSAQGVSSSEMQVAMAESFFAEERYKDGLDYLSNAIQSRKNQRLEVDENWYRRGLSVAYNNEVIPEVYDFTIGWVAEFPSEANWRDAINLTRNLNEFESPEMLDLMRLGGEIGTLNDKQDVILYVESADARRLPLEVKNLIEKAYADGTATRDDIFLADSLTTANQRIASDRAELPEIEAEADAASADIKTVMAAGDAFYSYGEYAKAERFYSKALGVAGVETELTLTRLGMSQIALGKYDEAQATLAKVNGQRKPIAGLWSAYADDKKAAASGG